MAVTVPMLEPEPNHPDRERLRQLGEKVRRRMAANKAVVELPAERAELWAVRGFFSPEECVRLAAMIDTVAQPSRMYSGGPGDGFRTSCSGVLDPRDSFVRRLQRRMDAEPHDEMPGNAVEYPDLEVTMRGKRWRISQMDAKQLTWCAENHKRDDVRSAAEARMAKLIDEQAAQHRADLDAMGTNAEYGMEPEPATQGELDGDMEDHP